MILKIWFFLRYLGSWILSRVHATQEWINHHRTFTKSFSWSFVNLRRKRSMLIAPPVTLLLKSERILIHFRWIVAIPFKSHSMIIINLFNALWFDSLRHSTREWCILWWLLCGRVALLIFIWVIFFINGFHRIAVIVTGFNWLSVTCICFFCHDLATYTDETLFWCFIWRALFWIWRTCTLTL